MINYEATASSLKRGIVNFIRRITSGIKKPVEKFIADMVYGMIASKSCKLSEIGKELNEKIALKKVRERLGRQLKRFAFEDQVMEKYQESIKASIGENTMIMIDPGDVTKPSSPKMEKIGTVWDASKKRYGQGYWTIGAVALTETHRQPIPVYEKLYQCNKEGGEGQKSEMQKLMKYIREHYGKETVRIIDSGFDSGDVLKEFVREKEKFIIRASQNRVAVHNGKKTIIDEVAEKLLCTHEFSYKNKTDKKSNCKIGMTQVTLTNAGSIKLNLVVCKGLEDMMVLYTNLDESMENIAVRVVKAYLMRWRIDECYEFKKQSFGFEGFRVRSFSAIRSLDFLLTLAAGYLALLSESVDHHVYVLNLLLISGRHKPFDFIRETKFFLYAIHDGASRLLASCRSAISGFFPPVSLDGQVSFFSS
jgi:hypothetical protein